MGALAGRQSGRISTRQLVELEVGRTTISDWVAAGYLHRELPGVYAVGHTAPSTAAELSAALLYAGRGAMLSHATCAWWYGVLDPEPPVLIDISIPGRRRSRGAIRIHGRRGLERAWRDGLPVTEPGQMLLDLATVAPMSTLRWALANAEYRRLLSLRDAKALLCRGRPGAAKLADAIRRHEPRLARTRSALERAFLALCEDHGIPLPEVNVRFEGFTVDAIWPDRRVAVELDGYDNHSTPAQIARDRRRDLYLRRAGYVVVRYTWEQVTTQPELVAADLARLLSG